MSIIDLKLQNGKPVGWIENGIAVIPVTSPNFLGIAHGYSIDGHVLNNIKAHGCAAIEFRAKKAKGKHLRISLEKFLTVAKVYNFGQGPKWACHQMHYQDVTPVRRPPDIGTGGVGYTFAPA